MPFIKILILSLLFLSAPLLADKLNIPGHYESGSTISMPTRGMTMDQVLAQFGEPVERSVAVGQPPITEWNYTDFRVFFEYRIVLHSVDLTTLIMPKN